MSEKLTADEIRTLLLFVTQYQIGRAQMEMAEELNKQYMSQLREKYGLSDEWVCNDALVGFEKVTGNDEND